MENVVVEEDDDEINDFMRVALNLRVLNFNWSMRYEHSGGAD
jgi:hypothetical protein